MAARAGGYKFSSNARDQSGPAGGIAKLSRLARGQRQRIAELTGCSHSDAASLVDHLSSPRTARGLLEELSPEGLAGARMFVEATDLLPSQIAEAEMRARLGETASAEAFADLERRGLLFSSVWAGGAKLLGLVPPLARSMRPLLWLVGDTRDAESLEVTHEPTKASASLSDTRLLVLAIAAVASDPPRIARDGSPHAADLSRLHKDRLGTVLEDVEELPRLVERLLSLGLLAKGAGGRVEVRWKRAEAFMDLPPASRLPLLLSTDAERQRSSRAMGLASAAHVCRLLGGGLAELPEGYWVRREALENAVRVRILAADALTPYADMRKARQRAEATVKRTMRNLTACLDVSQGDAVTWVRLPTSDSSQPDSTWIIQPDHEIVAPPDLPAGDLTRLVSIADLVRVDVVAQLAVGPSSVARAVDAGLDADTIIERLELRATRGLPEGLDVQIADWARQAASSARRAKGPDEEAESLGRSPRSARPPLGGASRSGWADLVAGFRAEAALRIATLDDASAEDGESEP